MKTASRPHPENSPTAETFLAEPDPAATAPPSLLDGTTFRFAHLPAAPPAPAHGTQSREETHSHEPNVFVSFAAVEAERLLAAARAMRRRRARLTETLFQWAVGLLLLSSGAAALWRLLWMGQ